MDKERALTALIEKQDRLTGRVIRTWAHIEWELGELLSPLTAPPHEDLMRQLWAGRIDFPAKCEMLLWLAENHMAGEGLEDFRAIMAQVLEQHGKISAIAHDRARSPYTAPRALEAELAEHETRRIRDWVADLDDLLSDIQRWHLMLNNGETTVVAEEEAASEEYEADQAAAQ